MVTRFDSNESRSLLDSRPDLASEALGWNPALYASGSSKILEWKCPLGHSYKASIQKRAIRKHGCPICSGHQVSAGTNDLITTHPTIAAEAFGWNPQMYSAGSNTELKWKCPENHFYDASISKRTSRKHGCPYCSGHQVWVGFNDLFSTHPEIALSAYKWNVVNYSAGSQVIGEWICENNHVYQLSISKRVSGRGCPTCSKRRLKSGFNDLATTHPELASQAYLWNPTKTKDRRLKKKWECENGHIWTATIGHRVEGQGCPSCSTSGYDPNETGYLYLIKHSHKGLLKVGISNSASDRTNVHRGRGWEVIDMKKMDGLLAYKWEQSILEYIKSNGGIFANETKLKKFDGWTEAWLESSFSSESLNGLMKKVQLSEEDS